MNFFEKYAAGLGNRPGIRKFSDVPVWGIFTKDGVRYHKTPRGIRQYKGRPPTRDDTYEAYSLSPDELVVFEQVKSFDPLSA